MPKFTVDINSAEQMKSAVHGRHKKEGMCLHETVSQDIVGLADIKGVDDYLDRIDYGLYSCLDKEGHAAVALGLGEAVFYTQGGENERLIGCELVSPIPSLLEQRIIDLAEATVMWKARTKQLKKVAQLAAVLSRAHDFPLTYLEPCHPGKGVTSHWNVSQQHTASEGHSDCHPIQEGGYFPINYVIYWARVYKAAAYKF